jgi:transcriptional regulator with XRE-family HTH domain
MDLRAVFIQNLKFYRKIRRISQMKLADLCDSSTSYIGQIEIGNKFPSIDMIDRMAKALNIRPYLLFMDEAGAGASLEPLPPRPYSMPETVREELVRELTSAMSRVVKRH